MVQASDIRKDMEVLGSDGTHVGTVDHLDGDRIKLTRKDSTDGVHHYVAIASVARVDSHVHLAVTAAAALAGGAAAFRAGGLGADPLARDHVVAGAARRPAWLPWLLGLVALIVLLLLARSCMHRDTTASSTAEAPAATAALPVEAVALPNGTSINLAPQTLNYELQRYLGSNEATPKTFQFDKLNFDTGSAAIRPQDAANVDALAQILGAYPKAIVTITGYTDARGSGAANAALGKQRADAVVAALAAKGVAGGRATAASGGESNPTDTNATAGGQFENRRTELTVTAK